MIDGVEHSELESRLTALGAHVRQLLTTDQQRWLDEFIGTGEYGLALEMLADWLSENETPIPSTVRTEARSLAIAMDNEPRVMGPLALCPNDD
jgi:hypothetical protein